MGSIWLQNASNTVGLVVQECMRIFPDSLLLGSGVYALVTQSLAYGILFLTLIESSFIYSVINTFSSYVSLLGRFPPSTGFASEKCRSGFVMPIATLDTLSMFGQYPHRYPFPSAPIFMLSVASSYIFTTLQQQKNELEALGPVYATRYYMSALFLLVILAIFISFRSSMGCDTMANLIISSVVGLILGTLLVSQNLRLFGPQSINLIGIPLLRNRTSSGGTLYICPTQN
ncbi:MAG: hypothetical protein EBU66_05525 [Bacteroidetes bacterium]|nr:hypothetical protein [bacterium]NBP64122.1 hypothetical protein [Bacteroidota bacterium]